jgi:hypothetical protein
VILSTDDKIKAKAYFLNLWESINQRRELNTNKFESAMRELDKSIPLSVFVDQNRIDHLLDDSPVKKLHVILCSFLHVLLHRFVICM